MREDALKLLRAIIAPTLEVLYSTGSIALGIVSDSPAASVIALQNRHRVTRFRLALLRVLQYISDCHRYPYEHAMARRAAQTMRVVDPSDAEAHMRLALNLSSELDPSDVLVPFFHFCVFLFNRCIAPAALEAAVVRRLVSSCSAATPPTDYNDCSVRARFTIALVPVVWDLIKYDGPSSEPIDKESLNSIPVRLKETLNKQFTEKDGRYLVGILLHLLYAMRPMDNTQTKIHPSGAQSDFLVTLVLDVISDKVLEGLKNATAAAKSRKKSCRRSRGKKRRGRGGARSGVDTEGAEIAAEVLSTGVNLEQSVPMLGPFSILCGYWAVQRGAPPPLSDLSGLAILLRKLREIVTIIKELIQITSMIPFFNHLCSRLFSNTNSEQTIFPALKEDDMFRPLAAVASHDMFRGVKFHEVALRSAVKDFRDCQNVLKRWLKDDNKGDMTYEQYASELSYKHMRAFALRTSQEVRQEVTHWQTNADGDALAKVVAIAIRSVRITKLVRDLERIKGGTLSREANDPTLHVQNEDVANADDAEGKQLQGSELDRQVRKKRRLVGSFSPTKLRGTTTGTATATARVALPGSSTKHCSAAVACDVAIDVAHSERNRRVSVGEEEIVGLRKSIGEFGVVDRDATNRIGTNVGGCALRKTFRHDVLLNNQVPERPSWAKNDEYWRSGTVHTHPTKLQ